MMTPPTRRILWLAGFLIAGGVLIGVVANFSACASPFPRFPSHPIDPSTIPSGRDKARAMLDTNAGWVGWVGLGLVVLSAVSLIASFVTPIITRREALYGFCGALACFVFQYVLYAYGTFIAEAAFWISLALALGALVGFLYPYYHAWRVKMAARNGVDPVPVSPPPGG